MKRITALTLIFVIIFSLSSCNIENPSNTVDVNSETSENEDYTLPNVELNENEEFYSISVPKIDNLSEDFIMGVDISSLLSLEASGRVFYGFNGEEQDLFKTLSESGVNYIRVRVWNDPFDENGSGYGGGNCTVDTAIELGKRAAEYGMGLLVDFHYSDFWADPGKQKAPKAWEHFSYEEKLVAIYDYTVQSINKITQSGVEIGMVQVGNETTGGLCGETEKSKMFGLMSAAAKAVRDTDKDILIVVHYTNPERKNYIEYVEYMKTYGVDYDVFATSYYPEYHGTMQNLVEQLTAVHEASGKKVMIAETSWAYTSEKIGAYKRNIQGQADEIYACIKAMADIGDAGVGVFYWEPAWIDVPGDDWNEIEQKREEYGAGWASSFAGTYDPADAGQYWGGTACISTSLFTPDGHPLESLKTFLYVRQGTNRDAENNIENPSFENDDISMWKITEANANTVQIQNNSQDAKDGSYSLHFWSEYDVEFTVEQTVDSLVNGIYSFSIYAQGDTISEDATVLIYVISDGKRYEQSFDLDGWLSWKAPCIENIICNNGTVTVGVKIEASAGAWGTIDCFELIANADVSNG